MDLSTLVDFTPLDTGLGQPVRELEQSYRDAASRPRTPCGRDAFLALLAGVPALRKTPGIPPPAQSGPSHFSALPLCATPEDADLCQAHLKEIFGITGRESMLEFCNQQLRCHSNYLDFEGFWEGRPPFDPTPLIKDGPSFFTIARDFSAQFYPIAGHRGYLAWDISECVGHLRAAYACGLITREDLDELAEHWIVQAQAFHSWPEFAVSLVCGALYWDFRGGAKLPALEKSLDLWLRLVRMLLDDGAAWGGGFWYTPPRKKEYLLWPPEFRLYLPDWGEPNGCLATDHITVLGKKVGWCYREEPDGQFPDSGWRFFSGEESDSYISDLAHTDVYDLNTICNYDPDVIPLLRAPYGTAYVRGADGKFRAEPYHPPKD
ncbi:DUF2185 domain-containing protein [Pseudoflavonifractor sp. 524-17]|uniref:immunity protein Imm33 domain-containing protein n=1 Tax=Pseudoflavonifractor sp. 524-17 TaxID=2304577 RepID=UPI00137A3352|nr:DUF2185 domain-containing protein [Pseudoflavonifractor sp. 524-17]NCE65373.1 DUF2185 domain-containing protein [Pseudoflavonifractor sp. 524-17]